MPLYIGKGCIPSSVSNNRINRIANSDTPPKMSIGERIKAFFCRSHKSEVLKCIADICHPPAGTKPDDVTHRFKQLQALAYPAYRENIQLGRDEQNHFCILDENSKELLSVTLDDAGQYTVECDGKTTVHDISTPTPVTVEDYEAAWSAWERSAPPEEASGRAFAVSELRKCLLSDKPQRFYLLDVNITSLPDHLPPNITELDIGRTPLTSLPPLPDKLERMRITDAPLTSLPALPDGLKWLDIERTTLSSLPELPQGLARLHINGSELTSLPELPHGLRYLHIRSSELSRLPELPRKLEILNISSPLLASLPELPRALTKLGIYSSLLTSLPALPELRSLDIYASPLTGLPELPRRLESLNIRDTSLTSLPELPRKLESLDIYNTQLTDLPTLPPGLESLHIDHTPLVNLSELPSGLKKLHIYYTPLTSLPALPSGVKSLYISQTPLTNLPKNIAALPPNAWISLHDLSLSEREIQYLRIMGSTTGPKIELSMGDRTILPKTAPRS